VQKTSSSNSNNNNKNKNNSRTNSPPLPTTTTTTMIVVVNYVIFVCFSQAWRVIREETAVAMSQGCQEAAPWMSQQPGLLALHIVCGVLCIALCWCWQCLLTVGGNLLPHTVTPLDVTTVAWCCRQTQDVLHLAECQQQHCKHHSDSGEQVSSLHDIVQEVPAVRLPINCVFNIICHSGFAVDQT